jgi:hypothetical protein
MKITIPMTWNMTKRPSTIGSLLARTVLKIIAMIINIKVRSVPCHLL